MAALFKGKSIRKFSGTIITGVIIAILAALILGDVKLKGFTLVKPENGGGEIAIIDVPTPTNNTLTDSLALLPIKNLFHAWEQLDLNLYMSQWSKNGLQHSREYKARTYDEIWSNRQALFAKLQRVNVDYYYITKTDRTGPNSISVNVQYTMNFYLKNDKLITEKDVLENYKLIRDPVSNRWLIHANYDYIE